MPAAPLKKKKKGREGDRYSITASRWRQIPLEPPKSSLWQGLGWVVGGGMEGTVPALSLKIQNPGSTSKLNESVLASFVTHPKCFAEIQLNGLFISRQRAKVPDQHI